MRTVLLLIAAGLVLPTSPLRAEIAVHTDFEGASGTVTLLDPQTATIALEPTDYPGRGWQCWWYVRLTGLTPGKTVTLEVGDAPWATPERASYSVDGGTTWLHGEKGTREGKKIRYALTFDTDTALVAWGPPFVPSDATALVSRLATESPDATAFSLCRTREGRDTPALRIATPDESDRRGHPVVWVQARQHAWESGSSWVGKGFAEWMVSEESEAIQLREMAEVVFVPIMDIDNTFIGAGGKGQVPQDHNRDWSNEPHWSAVRAAQEQLREVAAEKRLALFVDLHNPGAHDLFPYFYVPPADILRPKARENLASFLTFAKVEIAGPLRFTGRIIESGAAYDPAAWEGISKNWVSRLGTDAVAVTLETSWNTPASTTEGYETVGRQLGRSILRYLSSGPHLQGSE